MKPRSAVVFDVYRSFDPVLWEHNEPKTLGDYAIERDITALTLPEGAKPVRFHCRSLSREQRARVEEQASVNGQRLMAFRYGLLSVHDIDREDGGYLAPFVPARSSEKDALAPQMLDALEDLGFGDADFFDIGAAIVARSFLARGVPPRCRLPDSSQHACVLMLSRRAERLTPIETDDPSAPSSGEPDRPAATES
jgi:hypothetical protein